MRCRLLARFAPVALSLVVACADGTPQAASPTSAGATSAATAHARFAELAARYLQTSLAMTPENATWLGNHRYDDRWSDPSAEGDAARLNWIERTRAELAAFKPGELGVEDQTDASLLANDCDNTQYELTALRDAEKTPMFYTNTLSTGLDPLVTREFAPLEVRMKSLRGRLEGIPAIVAIAKKRLGRPPRVHTETAIEQTKGLIDLLHNELSAMIVKVPSQQAGLETTRMRASAALKDLLAFLEGPLLARSDGSFRVGREAFGKILRFTLDEPKVDPEAIERDARAAMVETRARMLDTAVELWPTLMGTPAPKPATDAEKNASIRAVLDKLAEDRSDDATIVADAKRDLLDETAFVRAQNIVRVPDEPCEVVVMPEYKRGFSTAYEESSGPLEKNPQTFLAIAPPPADWSPERRVSQYREYNHSMLSELIIHEGMPGHYLQQMHSHTFHSDVRAVLQNQAFVEGWAVYGEWMMARHGYGGAKVRMEQLKMLLRAETNTVLDYGVQAGTMEEKDALAMMRDQAFQEEGEAVGKWRRALLSHGQLTVYYYGFRELLAIRAQAEKKPGFDERAYNDRVLSFGSPPVRVIRERMLGN